jgi:hypothetical protein
MFHDFSVLNKIFKILSIEDNINVHFVF